MGMDITTYVKALIVMVMITPAGMMGISLSQRVGVMKVVLLGDSFANMVYDNTIGKMLTPPKLDSGSINATTLASNILQAQACAWAVQNHSNSSNIDLSKVYKDGKIQPAYAQDYIVSTESPIPGMLEGEDIPANMGLDYNKFAVSIIYGLDKKEGE